MTALRASSPSLAGLRQQQQAFVAALHAGGTPPTLIDRTGHGIATYVDGYRLRLRECLADDFEELCAALGHEDFERLADRVIAAAPSTDRTLNHWSRRLPAWLAAHPRAYPAWVRDVARVEWSRCEGIHAPLAPDFDRTALAHLPPSAWATVRLTPAPSLRLVPVRWRLSDLRPVRWHGVVQLWRSSAGLHRRDLPSPAGRLLMALAAGSTLAQAIARARLPAADIGATLTTAVHDGCFAGISSC
jgi:hypothetical protein